MGLFKKKKDKQDLSIVDDYKEPFTWRGFWDEQVVGRIKKIHDFLQEHGILFFLLSPFQYKSRLILKIVLIFAGILIGVVPRATNLLNQTKARNAASELAQASPKDVGNTTITPIESGQYKKTHLLVFNINGETSNGVPSRANGFDVKLTPNRGVNDEKHVYYKYTVIPVNDANRLLVMYVNNKKQDDLTGIYNLSISVKAQAKMTNPIEVVLSNTQKNTAIYKDGKVDLTPISKKLIKLDGASSGQTIKSAEKALKKQLSIYKINAERLEALDMTVTPTAKRLEEWSQSQLILTNLTDNSTTADITPEDDKQAQAQSNGKSKDAEDVTMTSSIKYKGKTYKATDEDGDVDESDLDGDSGDDDNSPLNRVDQIKTTELPGISNYIQNIQSAVSTLNQSRMDTYSNLKLLQNILDTKIDVNNMGPTYQVK